MNDDLRRRFDEFGDDELLRRHAGDALTEEARMIVLALLHERGIEPPTVADHEAGSGDDETDGDDRASDIITVRSTFELSEAHMLQSVLEAEGIAAYVADADLHRNLSHLTIGLHGIRVQVRAARLADAQRVLAALQAGDYKLDGDGDGDASDATPEVVAPGAVSAADMKAFVGDDAYVRIYVRMRDRGQRWAGVNVPVLFLGGAWFFFRRMYVAGAVHALSVLALMEVITRVDAPAGPRGFDVAAYVVALGVVRGVSALAGDTLYLRRAVRSICGERARGLDGEALATALRARGGTSLLAIVAYALLALGLRAVAF